MGTDAAWLGDSFVRLHPQTVPFWEAAADGRLLLPQCTACSRFHWYPRPFCPHCHSPDVAWREASGRGHIHAASMLRRKVDPYIVAYVALAEGPILLTNLLDCDMAQAHQY